MPRGGWRYIAQDLRSGEFLDFDVPLADVQITDMLTGDNALTGKISPEIKRLVTGQGEPIFKEWHTAIWADNGGEIRGGGIVTHADFSGPDWNLECAGYTGYTKDQPYTEAWFGVQVDPLDVFRRVWDHLQTRGGGNLDLQISPLLTGLKIGTELEQVDFDTESGPVSFEAGPVKLAWYQTHDLSEIVTNLATETPFDWHEWHRWEGDIITHHLDLGYPKIGRRRDDLRFVVGENVTQMPGVTRDGTAYANEALVLGAGEGAAMIRGDASRPTSGLRRVAVIEDSSLRSVTAANSRAGTEVAARNVLDDFTEVYIKDSKHVPIGSLQVGDEILINGDLGWRDLSAWARVTQLIIYPENLAGMQATVVRSDKLAS